MAGTRSLRQRPDQAVAAALADQRAGLDQRADALLQKERVALGPLDEQAFERVERSSVRAEQRLQQLVGARGWQGVQPKLLVVGLPMPGVLILRAVVHQQQQARGRQAVHQAIQQRLGLGVDPVQVLEHQQQRLLLALPQQQPLQRLEGALLALGRVEPCPGGIIDGQVQQRQEGRQRRLQGRVERQQLAGQLLPHPPRVVAALDPAVALQQIDHREVAGRLAVGDRAARQHQPALGAVRVAELPDQPRLAHPGLADQGDQLTVAGSGLLQRAAERLQLGVATDEPGQAPGGGGLERERAVPAPSSS